MDLQFFLRQFPYFIITSLIQLSVSFHLPLFASIFCLDFYSRFVLNVPEEDLQSFERILFLIEYAHWFYEDNSVEMNPSLKSLSLKEFTSICILQPIRFSLCLSQMMINAC